MALKKLGSNGFYVGVSPWKWYFLSFFSETTHTILMKLDLNLNPSCCTKVCSWHKKNQGLGGGVAPQNMYLLSSPILHTHFWWNLTTTFIAHDVPKFFSWHEKKIHRYLLPSPLHILWVIHAYQWLPSYLIQPLPGEHPGLLPLFFSILLY